MCYSSIWGEAHHLIVIHFQSPQDCSVNCNRKKGSIKWVLLLDILQLPLYQYSDLVLVSAGLILFYSVKILLIFMNRHGSKCLESPQQREKHCDVFCHLSGQSPWSCRVTSASLRKRVRRVRHYLNVLLFIYRLFHLSGHIMEKLKKWWEALSPLRNVSLAQALCLHSAWLGSSRIAHGFFSALLTSLRFAQLCSGLPQTTFIWGGTIIIWVFLGWLSKPEGDSLHLQILEDFILLSA